MKVLVIPNYTNFEQVKDINRDSFLLVFKSFLDNTKIGKEWEWILPYLNGHHNHLVLLMGSIIQMLV